MTPTGQAVDAPRILLFSALAQSCTPAAAAMQAEWPGARYHHLLDSSLADDLAAAGGPTPQITECFLELSRYAVARVGASGILFTCSAFGEAIAAVKSELHVPVVAPNAAAFEQAVELGMRPAGIGKVALVVTFSGSVAPLRAEFTKMAANRDADSLDLITVMVPDALDALAAGDGALHDRLIAAATADLERVDAVILGQFSMARAFAAVRRERDEPVLTTPNEAVKQLRSLHQTGSVTACRS